MKRRWRVATILSFLITLSILLYINDNWAANNGIINPFHELVSLGEINNKVVCLEKNKYRIKNREIVRLYEKIGFDCAAPEIKYERINPTKYFVSVRGAEKIFALVLLENFHKKWKAFPKKALNNNVSDKYSEQEEKGESLSNLNIKIVGNTVMHDAGLFKTWFEEPIDEKYHYLANGYANCWLIDLEFLKENYNEMLIKNKNKGYDFGVVIEFTEQKVLYLGYVIGCMTLSACILYLVIFYFQKIRRLK
jgi:hypothetical protein